MDGAGGLGTLADGLGCAGGDKDRCVGGGGGLCLGTLEVTLFVSSPSNDAELDDLWSLGRIGDFGRLTLKSLKEQFTPRMK